MIRRITLIGLISFLCLALYTQTVGDKTNTLWEKGEGNYINYHFLRIRKAKP